MVKSRENKNVLQQVALLISIYFPPEPGGGSVTALNRALILKKIGYAVYVICGFPTYPSGKVIEPLYRGRIFYVEKMGDFTLIRLRLLPLASKGYFRRFILFINFNFLTIFWMPRILRISSGNTLVYALAPILFCSIIGLIYSKITKSYFVYEVSAFWPEEVVAFKSKFRSGIFFIGKILASISYGLPDMIVVISESAAKYLANNYTPKAPVYTLPIGVDPSRFPKISKDSAKKELIKKNIIPDILEDKFLVLYAGVISRITRIDNLAYAANEVKDIDKNIAFLIIGEGDEKKKIEEIKSSKNINNLFLLPFQSGELALYIMSAADVCVVSLSSEPIYQTTVPTKFFDYLACNKPQIGICTGSVADIITSKNIGFSVEGAQLDKLVEIILLMKNSPALIKSMQETSKKVLKEFSVDNLALTFGNALRKEGAKKRE